MDEIIVPETGLPLRFPDRRAEAYARAQEFRRLSSDERWAEIASLMSAGHRMVRSDLAESAQWKRLACSGGRRKRLTGNAFNRGCSSNMAPDPLEFLEELHQALVAAVRALSQHQARYALIGGIATSACSLAVRVSRARMSISVGHSRPSCRDSWKASRPAAF